MLKKLMACLSGVTLITGSTAFANGMVTVTTSGETPQTLEQLFAYIIAKIMPMAYQIGGFFLIIAVIMIGFDLIKHRKNDDKRKEALHSLLWIAVGAFIIGSAVVIAGVMWNSVGR